jgi:hypothetical protein
MHEGGLGDLRVIINPCSFGLENPKSIMVVAWTTVLGEGLGPADGDSLADGVIISHLQLSIFLGNTVSFNP